MCVCVSVLVCVDKAMQYNPATHDVHQMAKSLKEVCACACGCGLWDCLRLCPCACACGVGVSAACIVCLCLCLYLCLCVCVSVCLCSYWQVCVLTVFVGVTYTDIRSVLIVWVG